MTTVTMPRELAFKLYSLVEWVAGEGLVSDPDADDLLLEYHAFLEDQGIEPPCR